MGVLTYRRLDIFPRKFNFISFSVWKIIGNNKKRR